MKPSGAVAGMRACSSGRLDGVSSSRIASRGRRSASAASTWPARSGSPRRGGRAARAGARRAVGRGPRVDRRGQRGADRRRLAEHGEVGGAAVRLGRVLGDDRDRASPASTSGPGVVGVLAEGARADDEDGVVRGEHLAQPRAAGRQVPGEARMVLRKAGLAPRTAPARRGSRAAPQARRARPSRSAPSAPAPTTMRGRVGAREQVARARRRRPGRRPPSAAARAGPSDLVRLRRRARPSRPSARSRSPGRGRWRPRGRRGRSRPARPAARTGWSTHTG